MHKKIKVIIAEDQELMRKSLVALLGDYDHMQVVGEASNGKQLLHLLKQVNADIVLLDVEMPIMNGMEAITVINARFSHVKVIVLSMHQEDELMLDFMTRGARAYLPKGCNVEALLETIEAVDKNGYYFSDSLSKAMLSGVIKEKVPTPPAKEFLLTERELEILRELCDGKTNKEIARSLQITTRTIDFHRSNIYSKTKSRSVAELVKFAIKHGVINAD